MEVNDHLLLVIREKTSLKVWSKIICPTKSTTLPTPEKTGKLRNSSPTTLSMGEDEVHELPVFVCTPWSFLQPYFVTAWLSPHFFLHFLFFQTLFFFINEQNRAYTLFLFSISLSLSTVWESKCYWKLRTDGWVSMATTYIYAYAHICMCLYL